MAGLAGAATGVVGLDAGAASAAGAPDRVLVQAGQSVQAAIDAVRPGGTVVVAPGTYREDLLVTKAVTLRGEPGAVLTRADEPAGTVCNGDAEAADAGLQIQVGICVVGQLGMPAPGDGDLPSVISPVRGVRIEGLALDGFDEGVESVGTQDLRLTRLVVSGSRDGAVLGWYGTGTVVQGSTFSGGLGFAALSLRRSNDVEILANQVRGNAGFGIALVDDVGGTVAGDLVTGNAGGFAAWDSGDLGAVGDMADVRVTGNDVSGNTRVFDGDGPSFGHVGLLLAGTGGMTVAGNSVRDNGASLPEAPFSGIGVALLDGDLFGGGAATGNRVVGNVVTGSSTPVLVQSAGTGNVVRGNEEAGL